MALPDFPFRIEFEITHICNLNCKYCYAKPFSGINPPLEKLRYLFTKTKEEAAPFEVVLLGGEPFVRKDVIDVIDIATIIFEHGVGISTNGTLLSRLPIGNIERLRSSVDRGTSIQVSFDSVNSNINERTRGNTEDTLAGLDMLEKHSISFSVGIVLTTANKEDIFHTSRYLLERYGGLKSLNIEPLQPTWQNAQVYYELRLKNTDTREIYKGVREIARAVRREDVRVVGVEEECAGGSKACERTILDSYGFKSCTAGLLRSGVFADGGVTPCLAIRHVVLGNLYTESWRTIWGRSRERFLHLDTEGRQCFANLMRVQEKQISERLKSKIANS